MLKKTLKLLLLFPLLFFTLDFSESVGISKAEAAQESTEVTKSQASASQELLKNLEFNPAVKKLQTIMKKELGDKPSKEKVTQWIDNNQDRIEDLAKSEVGIAGESTSILSSVVAIGLFIKALSLSFNHMSYTPHESIFAPGYLFYFFDGMLVQSVGFHWSKKIKDHRIIKNKKCLNAFIEKITQ